MRVRSPPSALKKMDKEESSSNSKIVIGVVGEKGSGKGTFTKLLQEILPNKTIEVIRSSDVLKETLKIWGLPETRSNLQKFTVMMEQAFGSGTLSHTVHERILHSQADITIFDGVRWEVDVKMIREFPKNCLVYITADPHIRHERTKARGEKAGEDNATFEEFMEEEKALTEVMIQEIGKEANFTINNNGTLEQYQEQVEQFCQKYLNS